MSRVQIILTLFAFIMVFHCGNAKFECPVPPNSSLIYFDLKQLSLMALQQGNHNPIHSPLLCLKGKDEECSEQNCCPDEVGCCLSNPDNKGHVRNCGCKVSTSSECTFRAPYAILANSECTADAKTVTTACLREKRAEDYLVKQPVLEAKDNKGRIGYNVYLVTLIANIVIEQATDPVSDPNEKKIN